MGLEPMQEIVLVRHATATGQDATAALTMEGQRQALMAANHVRRPGECGPGEGGEIARGTVVSIDGPHIRYDGLDPETIGLRFAGSALRLA
jgi:hypothetical protein